jgi:anhydro-N-acetylmuramic acid kinase
MSGTSLDGVDMVCAQFTYHNTDKTWTYKILKTGYIAYPKQWKRRLSLLVKKNAITYHKTHTFYGHYLGELTNEFIKKNNLSGKLDFVALHGHTVFHDPHDLVTSQIGDGAAVAYLTGVPAICQFRTSDVAAHGQGAPIVPITDLYLFAQHRFCLNLGGIANISAKTAPPKAIIGFDICANNLVLNHFANYFGQEYDNEGQIAQAGQVNSGLFEELNQLPFYKKTYPKSLDAGWVKTALMPIFERYALEPQDVLRTYVEHIAYQIGQSIKNVNKTEEIKDNTNKAITMLVTGGGAHNSFLMEQIAKHSPVSVIKASNDIINFKEALAIAFCGVLRVRGQANALSAVTGAHRDTVNGCIYHP